MHLVCHIKTHSAAATVMENQGFAFSRCRRCQHDLVRSLNSSGDSWREVPAGFRVAWRDVDTSMFAELSRAGRLSGPVRKAGRFAVQRAADLYSTLYGSARAAVLAPAHLLRLGGLAVQSRCQALVAVLKLASWGTGDALHLWIYDVRSRIAAGRSVVRLGPPHPEQRPCVLVINLNVQPYADGLRGSVGIERLVEA
jgi:hypothetical protein